MANEKSRLTDAQKKANHIESERKRREAIRRAFDALSDAVPGMQGQARSEAVMLQATVSYLTDLIAKRDELQDLARSCGMPDEDFDAVYDQAYNELTAAEMAAGTGDLGERGTSGLGDSDNGQAFAGAHDDANEDGNAGRVVGKGKGRVR